MAATPVTPTKNMIVPPAKTHPKNLSKTLIAFVLRPSEESDLPLPSGVVQPQRLNLAGFSPCDQCGIAHHCPDDPTLWSRPARIRIQEPLSNHDAVES